VTWYRFAVLCRSERERVHRGAVGPGQKALHVVRDAGRVVPAARVVVSLGARGRPTPTGRLPATPSRPPPVRDAAVHAPRPPVGGRRRGRRVGAAAGSGRADVACAAERQQRGTASSRLQTVFTGHQRRCAAATSSVRGRQERPRHC